MLYSSQLLNSHVLSPQSTALRINLNTNGHHNFAWSIRVQQRHISFSVV